MALIIINAHCKAVQLGPEFLTANGHDLIDQEKASKEDAGCGKSCGAEKGMCSKCCSSHRWKGGKITFGK